MAAGKQNSFFLRAVFLCSPLFLGSLALFGALTPGYSQLRKAVSELGALGTPWGMWFDFFGLLLPGLLTAGAAISFRQRLRSAGAATKWASGLVIYALMMTLTAVPADFRRMFHSPWTWTHAFFVLGAPLVLFTIVPGCAAGLRALGASRLAVRIFYLMGYLPALEFLLYGALPHSPGLVQRIMIFTTHAATAWLSWTLLQRRQVVRSDQTARPT